MQLEKIKPLKSFGQNFLKDKNIANKIIDLLAEITEKNIVEIGPGMGALSELLIAKGAILTAFDLDERAVDYLNEKFKNETKFKIIQSDIRNVVLNDYVQNEIAVIGNIPYNITNDIVFWLFENSNLIKTAVLTIQKEVAARYTAKPRTKDYGITTLAMQLYGNAKIAFHIPPGAFYPAPKVTSTVIVIDFSDKKKYCEIDKKRVIELIRAAFSKRRKIINNSIKSYLDTKQVNVKKLNEILQAEHKNYMNMRAEELTIEDYICFYEIIKNSVM